ncbi:19476_t:CDS:2, partial [Dentiscutata erythropus]
NLLVIYSDDDRVPKFEMTIVNQNILAIVAIASKGMESMAGRYDLRSFINHRGQIL